MGNGQGHCSLRIRHLHGGMWLMLKQMPPFRGHAHTGGGAGHGLCSCLSLPCPGTASVGVTTPAGPDVEGEKGREGRTERGGQKAVGSWHWDGTGGGGGGERELAQAGHLSPRGEVW